MIWDNVSRAVSGWRSQARKKSAGPLDVAEPAPWHVMCDHFSWAGWRHEGAVRIPGPYQGREAWDRMTRRPADSEFLLVESVWEDFYEGGEKIDKNAELLRLIRAFRRSGTPVFFWNKEDPVHFQEFLPVALLCDAIFTTGEECLPRYRDAGFRGDIEVLTFPAQPAVHRPYYPKAPEKKVFFAGAGRFDHEPRARALDSFLRPALALGCVDIFARKNLSVDRTHWPEDCRPYIVAELPYDELLKESSRYLIGLSLSNAPSSPTLYPRRVTELPLADVLVVSDDNRAVRRFFPEAPVVRGPEETRATLLRLLADADERSQRVEALKKRILEKHTCAHALGQMRSLVS
ncbi:MAG TPA: glycosyltransferase [Verrucomicrobiae bacterium]|jgi:spore maturation protein CgeB|nr:glycosyltransferase [Verrucomicrobiae bacterium]